MSAKTVFISYRRDPVGKLFARSLTNALEHRGYDVFLDVDGIDAGAWADQIQTEIPKRAHFLLLLTPDSLDRCKDEGDWVLREFKLARNSGRNIVPIREESVDLGELAKNCPESMKAVFELQIADLRHGSFEADVLALNQRFVAPHQAHSFQDQSPGTVPIEISRIDKYAPAELIGRKAETDLLSKAWFKAARDESERPHILTIVALGGEGKTSLVAKWAAELAYRDWPGCDAVFAWSFYSQGTREQVAASSDLFIKEALTFFGDPEIASSAQGAFHKGRQLAEIVGQRKAVLILDGLESLQYAPTSPAPGELKDQGIAALLKGLATVNHGLCVATTRYSITNLRAYWKTSAPELKLGRLSQKAGIELLKMHKVKGTQHEFETLVEDLRGHALTLNLIGNFLHDAHAGDIRKRDLVELKEADKEEQGGHAFHVMDAYVRWFKREGERGHRALAVLRVLGLFDRPVTADCLAALEEAPAIRGMTLPLVGISEVQRNLTLSRLESARLLTVFRDAAGTLVAIDTHPLLREYFAWERQSHHNSAWRVAHERVYKHLCATTTDKPFPKLEDLQPLYQAVVHGCQAGQHQKVIDDVCQPRIWRYEEVYTIKKLGAFGSDLAAIAYLFDPPWSGVSTSIGKEDQAFILNCAAYCLRAMGRLSEALEPMRTGLEMQIEQGAWKFASISANNLSELELTLGDIESAIADAEQSVEFAKRSRSGSQELLRITTLADTLHQAGRQPDAALNFRNAEATQSQHEPEYPLLYSWQGFAYCDLLLAPPERVAWRSMIRLPRVSVQSTLAVCDNAYERAETALQWYELNKEQWLLEIALDHLTQGRVCLYRAILSKSSPKRCDHLLQEAVEGLRCAGDATRLPFALLTRSWLRFLTEKRTGPESAQIDLDEAWETAERGPMPLLLADILLHRARLFGMWKGDESYPWESPQADLAEARRLIEKCGYWRRREELEDAEAAFGIT